MFILKNALTPLQEAFSSSNLGRERGILVLLYHFGNSSSPFYLFPYLQTFFAASIPFSASMSINVDFTLLWHPTKSHGINCGRLCGT